MPEIKIQHVVSCSSEDKNNPAKNLLKADGTHKWRSAASGEKQISVVLQFEKSSQIQSIDIGNEGAGFIEVLVGKSTAVTDQDYQVILVASTFMTPIESRNGTNRNAVRMFGQDKLSKTVYSQNWDRVKIVCTQPFNKNSPYGISFVRFHSPSDGTEESQKPIKKLGAFTIKSEADDDITAGSLFANRSKPATLSTPFKGPAAIRAASKLVEETKSPSSLERTAAVPSPPPLKPSTPKQPTPKQSTPKQSTPKPSPSTSRPSSTTPKRKYSLSDDDDDDPSNKTPLRKQSTSLSSTASTLSNRSKDDRAPPLKKVKSEPPKPSPAKEFSRLMEKVIFVMSGYQNPYRGELRDKAVEMGATYKPDWGRKCTHLICAFPNTPKYNQVQGKGKIVTKNWITDCYKQKKLLNWRKFRVGDADSPSESSDDEDEVTRTPVKPPTSVKYGGDTDSGDDTEEEIKRAKIKIEKNKAQAKKFVDEDEYGGSTDEDSPVKTIKTKDSPVKTTKPKEIKNETAISSDIKELQKPIKTDVTDDKGYDSSDSGLPELPDYFTDKTFFLYGEFPDAERRLLTRYITAYNGELSEYMNEHVTYIITQSKWDDNFDDVLSENEKLVFVKPRWIHMCHEKNKLIPHQPHVVVPN